MWQFKYNCSERLADLGFYPALRTWNWGHPVCSERLVIEPFQKFCKKLNFCTVRKALVLVNLRYDKISTFVQWDYNMRLPKGWRRWPWFGRLLAFGGKLNLDVRSWPSLPPVHLTGGSKLFTFNFAPFCLVFIFCGFWLLEVNSTLMSSFEFHMMMIFGYSDLFVS